MSLADVLVVPALWERGGANERSQPPLVLPCQAEEALVGLLRLAADGESIVEQRRVALLQLPNFEPGAVFKLLALTIAAADDDRHARLDRIPCAGLQRWLRAGYVEGPSLQPSLDELARVLLRAHSVCSGCEHFRYADFLRLVLPRDPINVEVRLNIFMPQEEGSVVAASLEDASALGADVSYALRRLIEEEVDLLRGGRTFRCQLVQYFTPSEVFALLRGSAPLKDCTDASVADLVTDQLGALSFAQAELLFRRLDVQGRNKLDIDDIAVLVAPLYGHDSTCDGTWEPEADVSSIKSSLRMTLTKFGERVPVHSYSWASNGDLRHCLKGNWSFDLADDGEQWTSFR